MMKQFENFSTRIIYDVSEKSQYEIPVIQNNCYYFFNTKDTTGKIKLKFGFV